MTSSITQEERLRQNGLAAIQATAAMRSTCMAARFNAEVRYRNREARRQFAFLQ